MGSVSLPNPKIGIPSIKPTYHEGKAVYINEPGLYALIMKSSHEVAGPYGARTSFAETFQDFVYEQILPSIRKRGRFELEQKNQAIAQKESQLQEEREYRLGLQ